MRRRSLPTRERELKPGRSRLPERGHLSLPTRERELKLAVDNDIATEQKSLPTREAN